MLFDSAVVSHTESKEYRDCHGALYLVIEIYQKVGISLRLFHYLIISPNTFLFLKRVPPFNTVLTTE